MFRDLVIVQGIYDRYSLQDSGIKMVSNLNESVMFWYALFLDFGV